MSVALIDVCPLGAYTESMVVMRLENEQPVLARFRRGNRKVNPESVRGASVMHGREIKISAESKAIYEIAWDNDGVDDEGMVKLQDCVVNAYIWNTKSKTFDWDGKLTKQVTCSYCENLKHQVH